jgi:hypothetical protein
LPAELRKRGKAGFWGVWEFKPTKKAGGFVARFLRVWLFLSFSPTLYSLSFGQCGLLYQKDGLFSDHQLGFSVAGAGDVNGDGKADFIIGSPFADAGASSSSRGSAYVYSGADGSLLYQKNGAANGDLVGYSVDGAGDVNGDGKADFIIGAYGADPGGLTNAGSAYVYSGADGSLLYRKDGAAANDWFGYGVAGAGDVNGDSLDDFIIGARVADPGGVSGAGSAYVYSGFDGSLLYQKDGATISENLGLSVDGAGDVNGDGRADFIIAAPAADPGGRGNAGSVFVYSGFDGSLLYQKDGAAASDYLGNNHCCLGGRGVGGAGDVNGDGLADFIIGAPAADPGGRTNAGSAYVYSGADGSLLYQKDGAVAGDFMGWAVDGAGDVNDDGRDDFLAAASDAVRTGSTGQVYVYSGIDGSLICQKNGAGGDLLGRSAAGAGDVNGDGADDFIAGAIGAGPGGSAYVYAGPSSCAAAKGDLNADAGLTPADVSCILLCVFLGGADPPCICDLCVSDVNCSGDLTAADVVVELNMVFLGAGLGC